MLIAAAVCPHAPILVPAVTGAGRPGPGDLAGLRAACDQAVAGLLGAGTDLLVIVGGSGDGRLAEYPLAAPGCLRRFGIRPDDADPATRAAVGEGGTPELPLSLTIGRWLAGRASPAPGATRLFAIPDSAPAAGCLAAGAYLAGLAPRVAMLVMGDGSARRAQGVPGAPDPEAERYDAGVAAALATADTAALAALDPGISAGLLAAGRAAWQVLAGAAAGRFRGEVLYAAAPFEVGYTVATWRPGRLAD